MKNSNGITLIALVITIIILIILAGVSINITIGEDGIITKAKKAKEDFEVSVILEELELLKINMRLENKELNIENYLGELQKTNSISSTVDQIDKVDENNAYVVLNEKYMFLIEDTNQNNVIITYEGIVGKLKPKIEKVVVDNTNNSISVKVEAKRAENYKFYIKDSLEKEYELKEENVTGVYTYIDLTQNVMYYIKIEAINEEGSVTKELTSFTTNVNLEASEVNDKKIVLTAKIAENEKEISSYKFYVNETLIQTIETNDTSAAYTWTSTFGDHTGYVIVTDVEGNESVSDTIDFEDYTIATKAELETFRDSVNNGNNYEGKTIIQTADIDLQGSSTNEWIPIGTGEEGILFLGTYDANYHSIKNMYISKSYTYAGLFGYFQGTIKNLKSISGQIIANNSERVGSVVGFNKGTIENCINYCTIQGKGTYVGGISGSSLGEIRNCANKGKINTSAETVANIGGIVGYSNGIIKNCYNIAEIKNISTNTNRTERTMIGGIAGLQSGANLLCCYNTGLVYAEDKNKEDHIYAGGVVGAIQYGTVSTCYNISKVQANGLYDNFAGGITGWVGNEGIVYQCYSKATEYGVNQIIANNECNRNYAGGIAGYNSNGGTINYGYTDSIAVAQSSSSNWCGGVVGYTHAEGIVQNSRYKKCGNHEVAAYGYEDTSFTNVSGGQNYTITKTIIEHINSLSGYVEDTNNINNGNPILSWE